MKRKLSILLAMSLLVGTVFLTPGISKAAGDVLLASVDWVNAQLNPLKSRVSSLETEVKNLRAEVNTLKAQIGGGTTPPPASRPSVVYVAKDKVTVHSGASRAYKVVATKNTGDALTVIDDITLSTGLWYRVKVSSTVNGWIYSGDVSLTKPSVPNPTSVVATQSTSIRSGASTSYKVLKTVSKGTSMKYLSTFKNSATGENWYNVQTTDGVKGWIFSGHCEVR